MTTTEEKLDELYDEYSKDPLFDHLRTEGINFVGGDGPFSPKYMLVGEAPGRLENAKRQPFQGRAGINLMNILEDVGIDPYQEVFMTNVIKYWPRDSITGETRTPDKSEIYHAKAYLLREIEIIKPKLVGLCGYTAITALYPKIPHVFHSHAQLLDNKYVPLYHPAFSTRNAAKKPLVVSGYAKLKDYLES